MNPADEISKRALKSASGFLADEKVTLYTIIKDEDNTIISENIESYRLNYVSEKLKLLTLQSGFFSRFKTDLHFRNNEFNKLYLEWIEKSVEKIIAIEVLVYYINEEEKGFVTLNVTNNVGHIGLIAVDEKERGKSIGKN